MCGGDSFKIIALDVEVLGCVQIQAIFRSRSERTHRASLRQPQALALAFPLEFVFLEVVFVVLSEQREQFWKVELALRHAVRKDRLQFLLIHFLQVQAPAIQFVIHIMSVYFIAFYLPRTSIK